MSIRRWVGAGLFLGAATLLAPVRPAAADLTGACTASGTFVAGTKSGGSFTVDAGKVGSSTVVIPREDTVNWTGSVDVPATSRPYSGSVQVKLPPPFGEFTIDSWDGASERVTNSGAHDYALPTLVPAGVTFTVTGSHTEPTTTCDGTVKVKIEGGLFDSPVAPISFALTAITGVGFIAMMRPLFRRSIRTTTGRVV
ncbi:unannotated protein [freshwater metagenome]|uniref:Unannotated protein n=1 Tax=freshwater metagenome TaxID=449393 RepID=A0A6J7EXF5_9ZZZZ|nr:hypothetical protein [Actinomycetota bacterium]